MSLCNASACVGIATGLEGAIEKQEHKQSKYHLKD